MEESNENDRFYESHDGLSDDDTSSHSYDHREAPESTPPLSTSPLDQLIEAGPLGVVSDCRHNTTLINSILLRIYKVESPEKIYSWCETLLCSLSPLTESGMPDIKSTMEQLKVNNTPRMCGHLFKEGEVAYSCKTCQFDATCVICLTCFKDSSHVNHETWFHRTSAGGCCDCGDPDAWAIDGMCINHKPKCNSASVDDSLSPLPPARLSLPSHIVSSSQILINAILNCITDSCEWHRSSRIASIPDVNADGDNVRRGPFIVALHNDDVHTIDQVSDALIHTVGLSRNESRRLTSLVDSAGYSVVLTRDWDTCLRIMVELRHLGLSASVSSDRRRLESLRVDEMLKWLIDICSWSVGLCELVGIALSHPDIHSSFLCRILSCDNFLLKNTSLLLQTLYVKLITVYEFKKCMCMTLISKYIPLNTEFLKGIGPSEQSIFRFTVQLFTVPSFSSFLLQGGALEIILSTLQAAFSSALTATTGTSPQTIDLSHSVIKFRRYTHVIRDLEYIMNLPGLARFFVAEKPMLLNSWCRVLSFLQGMDPISRAEGTYVEYDSTTWLPSFQLTLHISHAFKKIFDGIFGNNESPSIWTPFALQAINPCVQLILNNSQCIEMVALVLGFTQSFSLPCVKYNIMKDPVSFHVPVHRFLTNVIVECLRRGVSITNLFRLDVTSVLLLVEGPLRVVALVAQIQAGMWIRNGHCMQSQIMNYYLPMANVMWDLDLVLIQICAGLLGGDHIVAIMIERFGLSFWYNSTSGIKKLAEGNHWARLAEEFFRFLVILCTEFAGIGYDTRQYSMRREVLHRLCSKPCTFSELAEGPAYNFSSSHEDLELVINTLAEYRAPKGMDQGKYELRKHFVYEYDPFFYHCSRSEHQVANEKCYEIRKSLEKDNENTPNFVFPIINKPRLPDDLCRLCEVPRCKLSCRLVTIVLECFVKKQAFGFSETLVNDGLYILKLAFDNSDYNIGNSYETFLKFATEDQPSIVSNQESVTLISLICKVIKMESDGNYTMSNHWRIAVDILRLFATADASCRDMIRDYGCEENIRSNTPNNCNTSVTPTMPANERQTAAREQALLEIQRQQASFAASMNSYEFSDEDMEGTDDINNSNINNPNNVDNDINNAIPSSDNPSPINRTPTSLSNAEQLDSVEETLPICILCRERRSPVEEHPLEMIGFVQKTAAFGTGRNDWEMEQLSVSAVDNIWQRQFDEGVFGVSGRIRRGLSHGLHISCCSHALHRECFDRYFKTLLEKNDMNLFYEGKSSVDLKCGEFLCPLCKSISNILIPILPSFLLNGGRLTTGESAFMSRGSWAMSISDDEMDMVADRECVSLFASHLTLLESDVSDNSRNYSNDMDSYNTHDPLVRVRLPSLLSDAVVEFAITLDGIMRGLPMNERKRNDISLFDHAVIGAAYTVRVMEVMSRHVSSDYSFKAANQVAYEKEKSRAKERYRVRTRELLSGVGQLRFLWKVLCCLCEREGLLLTDGTRIRTSDYALGVIRGEIDVPCIENGYNHEELPVLFPSALHCDAYEILVHLVARQKRIEMTINIQKALDGSESIDSRPRGISDCSSIDPFEQMGVLRAFYVAFLLKVSQSLLSACHALATAGLLGINHENSMPMNTIIPLQAIFNVLVSQCYNVPPPALSTEDWQRVVAHTISNCVPFLRLSALFAISLSDKNTIDDTEREALAATLTGSGTDVDIAYGLCTFLGLPDLRMLVEPTESSDADGAVILRFVARWCQQFKRLHNDMGNFVPSHALDHAVRYNTFGSGVMSLPLISLPKRFEDIYAHVVTRACLNCRNIPEDPAICCVCGDIVCAGNSCCKDSTRVGECTKHARHCSNGIGMFFMLHTCTLILLRGSAIVTYGQPYLDDHGEEDFGLRRGRPLSLSEERHDQLQWLWLSHSIGKEVARIRNQSERIIREGYY